MIAMKIKMTKKMTSIYFKIIINKMNISNNPMFKRKNLSQIKTKSNGKNNSFNYPL